ncbi:serine/threonine-protein kinase [Nonomuraea sp. NEAU-A123]|uniref:serine/threonine-protein kinase n=1 Tax=Nonomuraea sp. NEAU-A123 TaxID=2839649 RepID=UPI001BE4D9AF|nr:serine/threonine-protein kinase [Nonomuraea sp. NEAU-A123]MBT2234156.1 protein kinase [Nonomuraea sp. NEAU-A123]
MTTGTPGETVERETAALWGFALVPGYREVRQLGAGHTGRVFLATYQATGAYVAIKYLNATLRRDTEFMERFRVDTPSLVELDDPNVVQLYEYVETSTRAAVVMELVDGVSLRTILAEHGRTSPEAALAVLKSTLSALAAAHEKGVPHRDVKPENVLVQADGTSKLTDFGVVVHAEEPGVPAGSPPYMSPELWTQGEAGPSADLYAAACLLFETVKGRPPYKAEDVPSLRDKHLVEPVPLEVAPDSLRDLLRRGLAKDPAVRYASALQFAAEVEEDAVAGYGPDWEKRGRRHLGELATLLALRFPLARTDAPTATLGAVRDRRISVPRLPPHLWIAGAAVVAVLIAVVLTGGLSRGPAGTVLMPQPKTSEPLDPSPVDDQTPVRRTSETSRPTARTATTGPVPPATVSSAPTTGVPAPTASRQAARTLPSPAVRSADIVQWTGSAGAVRVAADGRGPVRLRITYTRRDGDGQARTVHKETRTLTGQTAYTDSVARDLGSVGCGKQAHFGLLLLTEPAAANGPQVSEVTVDGPPCPTPSASHPTAGPPTQEPTTPTPSQPPVALPSDSPPTGTPAFVSPSPDTRTSLTDDSLTSGEPAEEPAG